MNHARSDFGLDALPGGSIYLANSPDTYSEISRVFLTNSPSRSTPHLLANTMIDQRQSDSSWPSLGWWSLIVRTPALAWISLAKSPTSHQPKGKFLSAPDATVAFDLKLLVEIVELERCLFEIAEVHFMPPNT